MQSVVWDCGQCGWLCVCGILFPDTEGGGRMGGLLLSSILDDTLQFYMIPCCSFYFSTANNAVTYQDGIVGDIMSIHYPSPYTYPTSYKHTWEIQSTGISKRQISSQKRIKLSIRDFTTEQCCDKVEVRFSSSHDRNLIRSIESGRRNVTVIVTTTKNLCISSVISAVD